MTRADDDKETILQKSSPWRSAAAILACSGALLFAGGASAAMLQMLGIKTYSIADGLASFAVDEIQNLSLDTASATMRLELWAFALPYTGAAQPGYKLAACTLADKAPPFGAIVDLRCKKLPVTDPPAGTWSFALLLTEFAGVADNDGFVPRDYKSFPDPVTYGTEVAPSTVDVVEFYWATRDHYFITADPVEIAALDNAPPGGFRRTGATFQAYATATAGASPVCRFYLPAQYGDSHYYSASPAECAAVRAKFPGFIYEAADVFYIPLPDPVAGVCPPGTTIVYRLWNRRPDTNHRYTNNIVLVQQTLALGYVLEGYGLTSASMCAPVR